MAFRLFLLLLVTTAVRSQETVSSDCSLETDGMCNSDLSEVGQEPSEDRPPLDHTIPKILIVGPTGSGKSSMANSLLGVDPQTEGVLFPVCGGWDSCTKGTSYKTGKWLGSGPNFTVIDTPGLGDSDGEDPKLITEMLDVLKNTVKSVDAIVLLLKGTENRFNAGMKSMLLQMSSIFGDQFWKFLLIGVSFWKYDQGSIDVRDRRCLGRFCEDEKWFMDEVQMQLEEKFYQTEPFAFAFIHSFSQTEYNKNDPIQQKHWVEETEKLWLFVTGMNNSFHLKGVDDIIKDNLRLKREVKNLKEDHETRIGNLEENGVTPVGTIIAWVNTVDISDDMVESIDTIEPLPLPEGWMRCDGSVIPSPSIWAGKYAPNLNGEKRFLRGGEDKDVMKLEDDSPGKMLDHTHEDNGHTHSVTDHGHTHKVSDEGHIHTAKDDGHVHKATPEEHTHKVLDEGHTHTVTDTGHAHTVMDNGHMHAINERGHSHQSNSHSHTVYDKWKELDGSSSNICDGCNNGDKMWSNGKSRTTSSATVGIQTAKTYVEVISARANVKVQDGNANLNMKQGYARLSVTKEKTQPNIELGKARVVISKEKAGVTISHEVAGVSVSTEKSLLGNVKKLFEFNDETKPRNMNVIYIIKIW